MAFLRTFLNFRRLHVNKSRYRIKLSLLLIALATGCGYDKFDQPKPAPSDDIIPNITLADLHDMASNDVTDMPDGLIIGGCVTTSDSAGNFYKRIVIQQQQQAVELKLGLYELYTSYHVGQCVVLQTDGLRLGIENGTLVLGTATPGGGVGFVDSEAIVRQKLRRTTWNSPITTPNLEIGDITATMVGLRVRVRGGHFKDGGTSTWSGEQIYTDDRHSLVVYTNEYATFAHDVLPSGDRDLLGVVTMYRDKLQLKLSSSDDATPTPF